MTNDYDKDRDYGDESDMFEDLVDLDDGRGDEGSYRREVINQLITSMREYLSFSTMKELLKLIKDYC